MKKLIKIVLGIVVLFVIVLAALPFAIDVNKYKGQIEAAAEKNLRAEVDIGRIRLSAFPYIGISVRGISVKHLKAPESPFDGTEAASLSEIAFKVHLKSLIAGRIVAGLVLKEPKIAIIKTAEGVMSVNDLVPPKKEAASPPPEAPPSEKLSLAALSENKWLKRVMVEEIKIASGTLHYTDGSQPADKGEIVLAPLDLTVSSIQLGDPDKPIRIDFGTNFKEVPVSLKTGVWLDLASETVRLGDGAIGVGSGTINFDIKALRFMGEAPEIEAKLNSAGFDLGGALALATLPPGVKLSGGPALDISAQGTPKQMALKAAVDLTPVEIVKGEQFVKGASVPFKIDLGANYENGDAKIEGLTVGLAGTVVSVAGSVAASKKPTEVNLGIVVNPLNVEGLKTILPALKAANVAVANPKVDIRVSGPTTGLHVVINDISAGIYDGSVALKGSLGLAPGSAYALNLGARDVEISKATETASGKTNLDLDASGTGLDMAAIQKTLKAQGVLKIVDGKLKTVNLASAVFSDQIAGAIKTALAGKGSEVALPGKNEEGTSFQSIAVPFTIANGRLEVSDLVLIQSGMEGKMQGSIGLDQTLDLTGRLIFSKEQTAAIVADAKIRGYVTDKDERLVIPFQVGGTIKKPHVTPDGDYVKTMFANAAKKALVEEGTKVLKEQAAPVLEKGAKELGEEAGKILKGLF